MTRHQVSNEARKRWGVRAFWHVNLARNCEVGFCDGFRDIVLGRGRTWQEALRQAPPDTLTDRQMVALPEGQRGDFARLHELA